VRNRDDGRIKVNERARALHITIDRPEKKNAMTPDMALRMAEIVRDVAQQPNIRAVVIAGTGDAYSSGADLAVSLPHIHDRALRRHATGQPLMDLLAIIARSPLPVISSVSGWALGAGTGMASASTFVVASRRAVFGLPEATLGVFPAPIAPFLVPRVGTACTMRWALTGERVPAPDAAAAGLVDILTEHDELEEHVDALVASIVDKPLTVLRAGMEWLREATTGLDVLARQSRMLSLLYTAGDDDDLCLLGRRHTVRRTS
jgi:enoyl-CoA hydratase/carnithine racemase